MPMHTSLRDGAEKNIEYGEIAQLARARGSYPRCRGFESPSRYEKSNLRSADCFFAIYKYTLAGHWTSSS